MGGRLEGKVALVTGAARGQGKSHCIRLAEEGAQVIAVDILDQIATVRYPMGSDDDLADTVAQVEATGQRILAMKADVRFREQLADAVGKGIAGSTSCAPMQAFCPSRNTPRRPSSTPWTSTSVA
jgi:NAD(P)-dependent dehydrogenase (short-subunit alcohol dehydrogenase family)